MERLRTVTAEAAHPMLLPGIFAEVELVRHTRLVEGSINEVEAKIFELDFQSSKSPDRREGEVERRAQSKRTAWLNLTYLRNSITTWSAQVQRMIEHVEAPRIGQFVVDCSPTFQPSIDSAFDLRQTETSHPNSMNEEKACTNASRPGTGSSQFNSESSDTCVTVSVGWQSRKVEFAQSTDSYQSSTLPFSDCEVHSVQMKAMRIVGQRIGARLGAIREDYDEKIRDCNMRVDGMAMATQWVR
jgi:hypothetical protein